MGFFTQTICRDHKYRTRCNDNERPHRENTVNQYPAIEADTIEKMQRLSKSLDLNPMKHVWDVLMRISNWVVLHSILKTLKFRNEITFSKAYTVYPHVIQGCYSGKGRQDKDFTSVGLIVVFSLINYAITGYGNLL